MALVNPTGRSKTLAPVHPNAGLEVAYRRRLERLIDEMHASLVYWLRAQYRALPPEMAQDKSPAMKMRETLADLSKRWLAKFDEGAQDLARFFGVKAVERSDSSLKSILQKAGFSVQFKMSRPANDALQAVIGQNIALIRSIAQQHLTDVQGVVMRSVAQGRDLGSMMQEIEGRYAITRRRAGLIARDQNGKATAVITRVRQSELGLTQAKWLHSSGSRHPRPAHVAFSGKLYDINKGAYLDGEWVWPGTAINCRCVSRAVISGFS